MHVSARMSYPDPGTIRQRARQWTRDPVQAVRADERGSGYRGTLSRGSHQAVNERNATGSGEMEIFVARALSSTLAMLQMHIPPDAAETAPFDLRDQNRANTEASFIDDLFSGVLAPPNPQ